MPTSIKQTGFSFPQCQSGFATTAVRALAKMDVLANRTVHVSASVAPQAVVSLTAQVIDRKANGCQNLLIVTIDCAGCKSSTLAGRC